MPYFGGAIKKGLLLLVLIISGLAGWGQGRCACEPSSSQKLFSNQFKVCGSVDTTWGELFWYEISLTHCPSGQQLEEMPYTSIFPCLIEEINDSLHFIELMLMPNASMSGLAWCRLTRTTAYAERVAGKVRLVMGQPQFVFKLHPLTGVQKRYIDEVLWQVKAERRYPPDFFVFEDMYMYALFLGALHDYRDSRTVYRHLKQWFVLDGAYAEQYGELPLDYMLEHLEGKRLGVQSR